MIRTIAATFGATLLAVPAVAGGLGDFTAPVVAAPAPAEPLAFGRDWTGGYVGAQIGYGGLNVDGTEGIDFGDIGEDDDDDDDDDIIELEGSGFTYGLRSGYDFDFGNAVAGGFLTYDGANIDTDADETGVDAEIDEIARAGLRLGYDAGNVMPYLAGGYAYVDTDNIGSSDGYFAGVGVESYVTENVSVGGEVLYHNFEGFDNGFEADLTTANAFVNFRF